MTRYMMFALSVATVFALAPMPAAGQGAPPVQLPITLKVGDPAPPLQLDKWLKGEPVRELEKGKVYVIELWATWCGPCVMSMPHVTRLQAKYRDKGVVVIGVDVMEPDPAATEPFLKKMGLKKMGARVGYRIATEAAPDGPEQGKMTTTWLQASGQMSVPYAFLVDRQGKIAWSGHPMSMDRPLAALAEDRYDPAEQAKHDTKVAAVSEQLNAAREAKDYAKALAVIDELIVLDPGMTPYFRLNKVAVLMEKGDYAGAHKEAAALADANEREGGTGMLMLVLGSTLLSAPDLSNVDPALLLRLATSAYEANGREGWQYQALLVRAHIVNKQWDKALEWQARVVQNAPEQIRAREEGMLAALKERAGRK
jgi:thiol-disulfide isomerase/thioredoxin